MIEYYSIFTADHIHTHSLPHKLAIAKKKTPSPSIPAPKFASSSTCPKKHPSHISTHSLTHSIPQHNPHPSIVHNTQPHRVPHPSPMTHDQKSSSQYPPQTIIPSPSSSSPNQTSSPFIRSNPPFFRTHVLNSLQQKPTQKKKGTYIRPIPKQKTNQTKRKRVPTSVPIRQSAHLPNLPNY